MNSQPSLFKLKVFRWGPTKNLQFPVVFLFSGPDLCAFSIQSLCPRNSQCINTPGPYTCVCQQGYYDVSSFIKPVASHPVCNGKLTRLIWRSTPFLCSVEFVSPLWPKTVLTQTMTTWKWRCIGAVTTVAPAIKFGKLLFAGWLKMNCVPARGGQIQKESSGHNQHWVNLFGVDLNVRGVPRELLLKSQSCLLCLSEAANVVIMASHCFWYWQFFFVLFYLNRKRPFQPVSG